jgi:tetratricopeptide (TPR) repeat protein
MSKFLNLVLCLLWLSFSSDILASGSNMSAEASENKSAIDSLLKKTDNISLSAEYRLQLSEKALNLSRKSSYTYGILHATYNIGRTKFYQGNLNESFHILDSLLNFMSEDSVTISKVVDYNVTRSKILSMIAIIFQDLDDYKRAMEYYFNALKLIENTGNNYDKALIFKGLGGLNIKAGNLTKAQEYFDKAITLSNSTGNHKIMFDINQEQYAYHLNKGEYSKALEKCIQLQNLAKQDKTPYMNAIAFRNMGEIYYRLNELTISRSYLNSVINNEAYAEFTNVLSYCYTLLSRISRKENNFSQSVKYATSALEYADKTTVLSVKADALHELATARQLTGNYVEAYKNLNLHLLIKDSINAINNAQQMLMLQSRYDISKVLNEKSLVENRLTIQTLMNSRKNFLLIGSLTIILLMGILMIMLIKKRQTEIRLSRELQQKQKVISEQEEIIRKEKEDHLKFELEHKNRELITRAMTLTQNQEDKLRLIDDLKEMQNKIDDYDSELYKLHDSLIRRLNNNLTANTWEDFKVYFENVYSDFYDNLLKAYPDLTTNELKLCALLKLNFNTKEIASLTCREVRSIESARNRLRKHLKLPPDINLVQHLNKY